MNQSTNRPLLSYRAETILTVIASVAIVLATLAILAFVVPSL